MCFCEGDLNFHVSGIKESNAKLCKQESCFLSVNSTFSIDP